MNQHREEYKKKTGIDIDKQITHPYFMDPSSIKDYIEHLESTMNRIPSEKYKHCNHHHELTSEHEIIIIDGEEIVANKDAVSLIKALNSVGIKTRTHHIVNGENCFFSILLDNIEYEERIVNERNSTRSKYNGKKELLFNWKLDFQ